MKKKISLIFLKYICFFAKIQLVKIRFIQKLKKQELKIVGITGSAGKSSTLDALESITKNIYKTKTNGHANSESGIPLNILDIKISNFNLITWLKVALLAPIKLITNWNTYQIYLVEMGIDEPNEPKNMSFLLKIFKPDISIFLNATAVHSLQFDHTVLENVTGKDRLDQIIKNIATEKAKIINTLEKKDIGIINTFDKNVIDSTKKSHCHLQSIGNKQENEFQIIETKTDKNGFVLKFVYKNNPYTLNLNQFILPSAYQVSLGSSLLAATNLGIGMQVAVDNLSKNFKLPPSRSTILNGINESTIIDSSYNSSLLATIEMLNLLNNFHSPKIAVLGDLRETGDSSSIIHQTISSVAKKTADMIICIGPETSKYFSNDSKFHKFTYWWQASKFLKENLPKKSTILVKGSQNTIFLEELIKEILIKKSDSKKLCRQTEYWLNTKTKFKRENQQT